MNKKLNWVVNLFVAISMVYPWQSVTAQPLYPSQANASSIDDDADGLTNTQEAWWCTNPASPDTDNDGRTDGTEIQTLKDWLANKRATPPGETPWPAWPFNSTTCPDKDHDSIPNLAELELGLDMDMESTDRDKFDDGQELFGVTYCPGGDLSCGYGDLPRSSDSGYVGATLPGWVKAPGNHPLVAAFPKPEVDIVPSSFHVQTVTTVTTDHVISSGTERSYSTAKMEGTGTSVANTTTWNDWEEVSETTPLNGQQSMSLNSGPSISATRGNVSQSMTSYQSVSVQVQQPKPSGVSGFGLVDGLVSLAEAPGKLWNAGIQIGEGINEGIYLSAAYGAPWNWNGHLDEYDEMQAREQLWKCQNGETCRDPATGNLLLDGGSYALQQLGQCSYDQNSCNGAGRSMGVSSTGSTIQQSLPINVTVKIPPTPTKTETKGHSWGGSQTNTTEQYEEHTVTNGEAFSSEESWGNATAVDAAHAADFWFTYTVKNTGTEYAREIGDLTFNFFIGDNPNPAYTYYVAPEIGGDGKLHNFLPGDSHTYTAHRIPLTLDQMKELDTGGKLRVVLEDYTYGVDELFYQNAINAGVQIAIEDGTEDGNEAIDSYVLPRYSNDSVLSALSRYFPNKVDENNELIVIWTPEYRADTPSWCAEPKVVGMGASRAVWCKHALTTADWWNIYTNNLGDGNQRLSQTLAVAGGTALFRFNKDSDLDGYSDRSEMRLSTNAIDPTDFPEPQLLAGLHQTVNGSIVVATLSLLNTGAYDAYGVEAVMIAPDDSITITNNTVGGSGRVKTGQTVVVGSRILPAVTGSWPGTAKPVSSGYYQGTIDRSYTFTVVCSNPGGCDVGSGTWSLNWSDGQGATGSLNFGSGYASPTLVDVGSYGVKVGLVSGRVYNGNTFSIAARTPRDTFQYTINRSPYTQPVVIVSYNDPQGNHRFILPGSTMQLSHPTQDLLTYATEMRQDPGVEIVTDAAFSSGANMTRLVVNNPAEQTLVDAKLFLDFIDSHGVVVYEGSATQTIPEGPSVVAITWNTADFSPAYDASQEYIVLAFWTDREGNIIDTAGRPLSSFQADPRPEFAMTEADTVWNFGEVQQGSVLKRTFTFANTGMQELLTYVSAPAEVNVSQLGSRELGVADTTGYDIELNTSGLSVGGYDQTITIRTSDPNNPQRTVRVVGTITAGTADTPPGALQRPLDYTVTIPGAHSQGEWVEFTHDLGPEPQTLHPVKIFSQDYLKWWGVGKYAIDFSHGTAPADLFGDGSDGAITISTNTINNPIDSACLGVAGTYTLSATNVGFGPGQVILIHQTQGINAGTWMINKITDYFAGSITLSEPLNATYSTGAQVLVLKQYTDVTVNSGITWTVKAWNGTTGGILAYIANGTTTVSGFINLTGKGYRGAQAPSGGNRLNGYNGEGINGIYGSQPGSAYTNNGIVGGGGAYNNGADAGSGGGGGGYATSGSNGVIGHSTNGSGPGAGGGNAGRADLLTMTFGGGGGSGSTAYNATTGGFGGSGGGILFVSTAKLVVAGGINSAGATGGNGGPGYSGGGGGGAGGAIHIKTQIASIGTNLVTTLGGAGGNGGDGVFNMKGGSGGNGRIHIEYCNIFSGSTDPSVDIKPLKCYITEQKEVSPFTTTRLNLNEGFLNGQTYQVQYGRRFVHETANAQNSSLSFPSSPLNHNVLQALISDVGNGSVTFRLDVGNDGAWDWTYVNSVTDAVALTSPDLSAAFNAYWAANGAPTSGTIDVPVRVYLDKPGQVLLTDLQVTPSGSKLRSVRVPAENYSAFGLSYTLNGATGPVTVGIDVGDNGTVDDAWTSTMSSSLSHATQANLAAVLNAYLSGRSGEVDVPIRVYVSPSTAQLTLDSYETELAATPDVTISPADIILPALLPVEGNSVPLSVVLHNPNAADTGGLVTAFFATPPGETEWYLGSAYVPNVPRGGTATAALNWNTLGFYGNVPIRVEVDPMGRLVESSETNNQAATTLTIRTRPDLVVADPNWDEQVFIATQPASVQFTLQNQGETPAAETTVSFYDGNPTEGGMLLSQQNVTAGAGSQTALSVDWTPQTPGKHRLFAVTDSANLVNEFQEVNNITWQDVFVGLKSPILLDSGVTDQDPLYSMTAGFGVVDIGQPDVLTQCSVENLPESTLRRDPGGKVEYRFDHLVPSHYYHLDVLLYECDGVGRQESVYVDGYQLAGPEDLGDRQVHRLTLLVDPALYNDRTLTVNIQAPGIDGATVASVSLHDVDYRYVDAGNVRDLAYTPERGVGWLDATSQISLSWGSLPYQSVRVDSDRDLSYRFDGLKPDRKYNVHLTFWQLEGAPRIQKVWIDQTDPNVSVNSGDYQIHRERISVPIEEYLNDGSIVVKVERLGASGAMINEISLEEATIQTTTSQTINPTPYFSNVWGNVTINVTDTNPGQVAPVGTLIQAVSPRGEIVGTYTVDTEGQYGFMRIYGEDVTASPIIPGMKANELVSFLVNGAPAVAKPSFYWQDNHLTHRVDLSTGVIEQQPIVLRPGWNLISFPVEPPSPVLTNVLQSIYNRYDRVLNETGVYSPALADQFNTLKEMHSASGYYVRSTEQISMNLLVDGLHQTPGTPISLHAGWNWVGYLPTTPMNVEVALASIVDHVTLVHNLESVFDPKDPIHSTLTVMRPGEGYLIHVDQAVTLIYPTAPQPGMVGHELTENPSTTMSSPVEPTPNFTVVFGQALIKGEPAPIGTRITIHTPSGDLAGFAIVDQQGVVKFTHVYGSVDGSAGFNEGETMAFKINGFDAEVIGTPVWSDDKSPHEIVLNLSIDLHSVYLPILSR